MEPVVAFLHMGGYAGYVWPAYGIALAVLGGLVWASIHGLRARRAELAALEASLPRRHRHSRRNGR